MIDNRLPEIRFLDDIHDLAQMAAITEELIDIPLSYSASNQYDGEYLIFRIRRETLDKINFAVSDIRARSQSLAGRCEAMGERLQRP